MPLPKRVPSHSLTVRLSVDLYARLQICALEKQRSGDAPELSQIVREAIEHYLARRERHQRKTQRKTLRQTRKAAHG
jgi:predicted transcriptional regulator